MKSLALLNTEAEELRKKLTHVKDQIQEIKTRIAIPALRKNLIGRCFKFRNSYSCPEKESDYWWTYFFVTQVCDLNSVKCVTIETDRNGKISIEFGRDYPISMLGDPVTKTEFNKEYHKVLRTITNKKP